jgi:hypothetical protein
VQSARDEDAAEDSGYGYWCAARRYSNPNIFFMFRLEKHSNLLAMRE